MKMANNIHQYLDELHGSRVWRSIFRSGEGASNLHRAQAVQRTCFCTCSPSSRAACWSSAPPGILAR